MKDKTLRHKNLPQVGKTEMVFKAMSAIILYLKNKLLREFDKEKTTKEMWTKHE